MKRSGVLLHISSLASPYGIGTLGQSAMEFVDFLESAGQQYWQLLPVCPTGYGDSPYQSFSSFAGNPYFIDLDILCERGLLGREDIEAVNWGEDPEKVDYGLLSTERIRVLRKAARKLRNNSITEYREFCENNSFWLDEYSLFMSLKDHYGGKAWLEWDEELKTHDDEAVDEFIGLHADEIEDWKIIQYVFSRQWHALKQYAADKGVKIIGDMPIYVSLDSADVWSQPWLFELDKDRRPHFVSGCPPDGFSETGQLWGNPLFNWERMKEDGYEWWCKRIRYLSDVYDVLRIDHFRGFESYYAIPYGSNDAKNGTWRKGPGIEFFHTMEERIGKRDIIAEDLGFLTPEVRELLKQTGYPGMKVLEMAFDARDPVGGEYLPHNYPEHCVAYLGTHDNDTIVGWLSNTPEDDAKMARDYLGLDDPAEYNWKSMRALWSSAAGLVIVQAQDLLGLGSEARMNVPSVPDGNWQWRAKDGAFTPELAGRIRQEMTDCGRI
ncbi:MAG: 4-alpha-glucanotransferase [Mogibacterium sp.]|nr:4-alpha-glucanotransferase [Mogibacterium sp.]